MKSALYINYFKPSIYVRKFTDVNLTSLARHGIKIFITDLDNTLAPHFKKLPSKEVYEFVKRVKEHDMELVIVSNNIKSRVKKFADKLDVPFYANAKKPLRGAIQKIIKHYNVKPSECIMMGDQLVTDVLVANRCHIESILVQPMVSQDIAITKFNRILEKFLYSRLSHSNILHKGAYDDGILGEESELL